MSDLHSNYYLLFKGKAKITIRAQASEKQSVLVNIINEFLFSSFVQMFLWTNIPKSTTSNFSAAHELAERTQMHTEFIDKNLYAEKSGQ